MKRGRNLRSQGLCSLPATIQVVFGKRAVPGSLPTFLIYQLARFVQQDGIHFQGRRYLDPLLADYVKEEVLIRYDPADMAEIRVFYQDCFLCRAICPELSGETVSLKEIEKARTVRRKQLKAALSERQAVVEQFFAMHQEDAPKVMEPEPEKMTARPRLKRYFNE